MSTRFTTHRALGIAAASYATLTLIPWAIDYTTWGAEAARAPRPGLLLTAIPFALLFGALAGYATAPTQAAVPASAPDTISPARFTPQGTALTPTSTTGARLSAPTRAGPAPAPARSLSPASPPPDRPVRPLGLITSPAQPLVPSPSSQHAPDVTAGT